MGTILLPHKMHVAAAAPLLCAGITCYSPLVKNGVKAGDHLGVVGLGGLGHMAVKIGVAMGCIVTVITTSEAKREMALKMGASRVVISKNAEDMKAAARSMHFIYNSIAFDHDVQMYLDLLKNQGTMILVGGVPVGAMPQGSFALIGRGLKMAGSLIGGIRDTQAMIDFCAKHDILCEIELVPATPEAVDVAWERTVKLTSSSVSSSTQLPPLPQALAMCPRLPDTDTDTVAGAGTDVSCSRQVAIGQSHSLVVHGRSPQERSGIRMQTRLRTTTRVSNALHATYMQWVTNRQGEVLKPSSSLLVLLRVFRMSPSKSADLSAQLLY